jgi:hypothetical protein
MASILEDVQVSADWISKALASSGYNADFSPDSLIEIDRFFAENVHDGKAVASGLLSESLGSRLFAIGSYVGEVIRRNIGGEWRGDDSDPQAEINVAFHLANGTVCWPVQRAMKRFRLGAEESIAAYGAQAGLQFTRSIWPSEATRESITPQVTASKRPWWKVW